MSRYTTVLENFREQKPNRYYKGDVYWNAYDRMFCDKDILYSYGTHFPLAKRLVDSENENNVLYIINADRYSVTTSGHQSYALRMLRPNIQVSRNALETIGIRFENLKFENIVDYSCDNVEYCFRYNGKLYNPIDNIEYGYNQINEINSIEDIDKLLYRNIDTSQGMFVELGKKDIGNERISYGYWHVVGGVLIEYNGYQYVCTLDENQYCVIKINGKYKSFNEAVESLKPDSVRNAERKGIDIYRQGEWFFVKEFNTIGDFARHLNMKVKDVKKEFEYTFPDVQADSSNIHYGKYMDIDSKTYATGMIRHCDSYNYNIHNKAVASGEHKATKLGRGVYQVFKNTELESVTESGKFD